MTLNKWMLGAAWLGVVALGGCTSTKVDESQYSGFLSSYQGLEQAQSASGQTTLRWIDPKFSQAKYDSLIYQPVRFYPTPKPSERITQQTYDELLKYGNQRLAQTLSRRFKLVGFPSGSRTLEFRGAITGVSASTQGLKPYEVIPIALVAAGAMTAAGQRDQNTELYLEAELIDTSTGKAVLRVVRKDFGKTLSNDQQAVTFADLKPVIDGLMLDVVNFAK